MKDAGTIFGRELWMGAEAAITQTSVAEWSLGLPTLLGLLILGMLGLGILLRRKPVLPKAVPAEPGRLGIADGGALAAEPTMLVQEGSEAPERLQLPADAATQQNEVSADIAQQESWHLDFDSAQTVDRHVAVGRLAAGVLHDLGTPLNVITGRASMISSEELTETEVRENAAVIHQQAHRIAAMVRKLLDFARALPGAAQHVDMRSIMKDAVALVEPLAHKKRIKIEQQFAESLPCSVEVAPLQQAINNYLLNALSLAAKGSRLQVRARLIPASAGQASPDKSFVQIGIEHLPLSNDHVSGGNTPPPFPPAELPLGLAVAEAIVKRQDGWSTKDTLVCGGERVEIYIPQKGIH